MKRLKAAKSAGQIFLILLGCYIMGFSVCFVVTILGDPGVEIADHYYWAWRWASSFELFFDNLLAVHCAAIIVVFSLLALLQGVPSFSGPEIILDFLVGLLIPFLVLTAAFTFVQEGLLPIVQRSERQMIYYSRLSGTMYDRARQAVEDRNIDEAILYLEGYLEINPEDSSARDLLSEYHIMNAEQNIEENGGREGTDAGGETGQGGDYSTDALVAAARENFEAGDLFTAYHFASLALEIAPERGDARDLANRSLQGIRQTPGPEAGAAELYREKLRGYTLYSEGRFLDAYWVFKALLETHPDDRDSLTYFELSLNEVRNQTFFSDEVLSLSAISGIPDILFFNRRDDSGAELVYIRHLVASPTDGTLYAFDVEAQGIRGDGTLQYQLRAPYGKIMGTDLNLQCIDRDRAELRYYPEFLVGQAVGDTGNIIDLRVPVERLGDFSLNNRDFSALSFGTLFALTPFASSIGVPPQTIQSAMLFRIAIPLSFIMLTMASVGIGWHFRRKDQEKAPYFFFIFFPAFPFIMKILLTFFFLAFRNVVDFVLYTTGFWPAVIAMVVIEFGLFFFSTLFVVKR